MNLLGVDPGFRVSNTGYAWTTADRSGYGCWNVAHEHPGGPVGLLYAHIIDLGQRIEVQEIATEGGYPIRRKGADRLEWMRGAVHMAGAALGVPVYVVAPSTLKKFATGHGGATKADMLREAELMLNVRVNDDDVCDAIWLLEWLNRNPAGVPTKAQKRRSSRRASRQGKSFTRRKERV